MRRNAELVGVALVGMVRHADGPILSPTSRFCSTTALTCGYPDERPLVGDDAGGSDDKDVLVDVLDAIERLTTYLRQDFARDVARAFSQVKR